MNLEQFDMFGPSVKRRAPSPAHHANGQQRKIDGQFSAAKNAGQRWLENVLIALRRYIDTEVRSAPAVNTFTFENFRLWCAVRKVVEEPKHLNAWGAVPSMAFRAGMCRWTGQFTVAQREEAHCRYIKVWEAL